MEQMEKFEDNKTPLPEADLQEVAGGSFDPAMLVCHFTPEGLSRKDASGIIWAKCSANCFGLVNRCSCNGKSHCVDRWHRMTFVSELSPRDYSNHKKKLRDNNFNTN